MTERRWRSLGLAVCLACGLSATPPAQPEEMAAEAAREAVPVSPEVALLSELASPEVPIALPSHDPAALDLLEQMATAHADLQTLTGEFRQRTDSEMFLEEDISTGRFLWRRPDRFRYDYESTELTGASTCWFIGDMGYIHIPEFNQLEIYHLDSDDSLGGSFSRVLIGLDGALEELRERHWIGLADVASPEATLAESIARVTLEPKEGVDPDGLVAIDVWINSASLLPAQVKMVEESGDTTTLTFTTLSANRDLDDDVFDPSKSVPEDVNTLEFP
jgi:outer membrane lipoprotein-sorting protein